MRKMAREDQLELRNDGATPAYYLFGQAVGNGDRLEVTMHGLRCLGTFSWSGRPADQPKLVAKIGRDWPTPCAFPIAPEARCRLALAS
jgi:hypothetical protein